MVHFDMPFFTSYLRSINYEIYFGFMIQFGTLSMTFKSFLTYLFSDNIAPPFIIKNDLMISFIMIHLTTEAIKQVKQSRQYK